MSESLQNRVTQPTQNCWYFEIFYYYLNFFEGIPIFANK